MNSTTAYTVRLCTDTSSIAALAEPWRELQWNPYFDFDYMQFKYSRASADESPCILVVSPKDSTPVSIFAGSIQKRPVQFQVGYKRWRGPELKTLVIPRFGILGENDRAVWDAVERCLEDLLLSHAVDVLMLSGMRVDSPPHALPFRRISPLCRDPFKLVQEYWQLTSPGNFQDFVRTHRRMWAGVRNCANRIHKRSGGTAVIQCRTAPEDADLILEQTEQVARETWQRSLGSPTFMTEEVKARTRFNLSRGWLKVYSLHMGGQPVAFLHGLHYGKVMYFDVTGYHPQYRHEGVGTHLFMKAIEAWSGREDVLLFDFREGNSPAKSLFCDISFKVADRYLVAPTMRLKVLNLLRLTTLAGHMLGKRLLAAAGMAGKARSAWRYGSRGGSGAKGNR